MRDIQMLTKIEQSMDDILKLLGSPGWWFSVVVVGIFVSLAANYFKSKLDTWLARLSRRQLQRNERARELWDKEVSRLASDNGYKLIFISRINHKFGQSAFFMLGGITSFLMSGAYEAIITLPYVVDPEGVRTFNKLVLSLPKEKTVLYIKIILGCVGSIGFLMGAYLYNDGQKLQKQLEESAQQMVNKANHADS